MSAHYETLSPTSSYREVFGVELPFFEDDFREGKALPTGISRISRIDGERGGFVGQLDRARGRYHRQLHPAAPATSNPAAKSACPSS